MKILRCLTIAGESGRGPHIARCRRDAYHVANSQKGSVEPMLLQLLKNVLGGRFKQAWTIDTLLSTARAAFEKNDLAAAEQAVDALLEVDPERPEGLYYRGLIAYHRRDFSAALPSFRAASLRAPDNADYIFQLAACQANLGDIPQATQSCRIAMEAHPYDPRAYTLMSQINFPGTHYVDLLAAIHRHLSPRTYLEIGVETGKTLVLAGPATRAIGVDPEPKIQYPLGPNAKVFALTSDDFFSRTDVSAEFSGTPVDLAFIDGMHHFEFALRDFVAIERYCTPRSTILVHDCYPLDRRSAERERATTFWSGDVWRLVLTLKKHRPDLEIHTIAAAPTGLTIIRKLDPNSRLLAERMDEIVSEFLATDYSAIEDDKPGKLNLVPNVWARIERILA